MRNNVSLRIDDLQKEVNNTLREAITETSVTVMKWIDGDFQECKTLCELRKKLYKEFNVECDAD